MYGWTRGRWYGFGQSVNKFIFVSSSVPVLQYAWSSWVTEAGGVLLGGRAVVRVRTVCKQFCFCFVFRACSALGLEFLGYGGGGESVDGQEGGGTGSGSL